MPALPTGTVTFLFTDIEGSTTLLEDLGDAGYARVFADHGRLLRAAFDAHGGQVIETQGDGFLVVFQSAHHAVLTAIEAQRAVAAHPWPQGAAVRVRMGLHSGEPLAAPGGYIGLDVHRAARICQAGWGGQVLISQSTRELIAPDLPAGAALRDLGAHRLKGLNRPEQVSQIVLSDLPAEFPPLRSLDSLPNNLPRQLTSFIGRTREMGEIRGLLAANRLVTLTGTGGCGKTRLALEVAAELLESSRDGVWFIDLTALTDPALVPQAVASVLGVRERAGRPMAATLEAFLTARSLLLVLDNCEHLIGACADLAGRLLQACPGLRILATSRERLKIAGEAAYLVPSLSLPDLDRLPALDGLAGFEAVQLFLDRARAADPAFQVTQAGGPTVARICHRLDGIPLAIELAAARVKVLTLDQIAGRLADRFRLLTGGSRVAPLRQQTLRAALDWSYALLAAQEQPLFDRLSVFAGGWTLEAAEAVCAGDGLEAGEVLDLLTQLVDKSLVVVDEAHGAARFRMLETVREYAREKLTASGREAVVHRQHRDWFLALAERGEAELRGAAQAHWLNRFSLEHDNLRAALEWSRVEAAGEAALRLAAAMGRFWWMRGFFTEGRAWLEGLLRGTNGVPAHVLARAYLEAGRLAWAQGDIEAAGALSRQSLARFREIEHSTGIADALNVMGLAAMTRSDYPAAREHFQEARARAGDLGDERRVAVMLSNLGLVCTAQAEYAAAAALHQESLRLRRALGDVHGVAISLNNLGLVHMAQGEHATARTLFEEGLRLREDLGDRLGRAFSLHNLSLAAFRQAEVWRAVELAEESLTLARELGDAEGAANALLALARIALHQRDLARAASLCGQSLHLRQQLGDRRGIAEGLELLAAIAASQDAGERAARLFRTADHIRTLIGAPLPDADREEHARHLAAVQDRLGPDTFVRVWNEPPAPMERVLQEATAGGGPGDDPGTGGRPPA